MKMSDIYRGDSAKPQDIQRPIRVRINKTEVRELPGFKDPTKKVHRLVLSFENFPLAVIVNGFAAPVLRDGLGDDITNYIGREVVLYVQAMPIQGRMQDVILIRLPRTPPTPPPPPPVEDAPPPVDPNSGDFDDDIPF